MTDPTVQYDTTVTCVYLEKEDSISAYQHELLSVFKLTKYEGLVSAIENLFQSLSKTDELNALLEKVHKITMMSSDLSFFILFSYDYFDAMHPYLCSLLKHESTIETHTKLMERLQ